MTLKDRIKEHEGLRLKRYKDPKGNWTIGYGHLIRPGEKLTRITKAQAEDLLDQDIRIARADATDIFPDFGGFSQTRREVLVELLFNMGVTHFRTFDKMIHACNIKHWETAADELKDSKWYREDVGRERGDTLVELLREGEE